MGELTASGSFTELSDWNQNDKPLRDFIHANKLKGRIKALSPHYRMSKYCFEGDRGYIQNRIIKH